MNARTVAKYSAFVLSAIVAVSVGLRLLLWHEGAAQYASAGAADWVYPAITTLQACACAGLLFRATRPLAAAGVFLVPTALVFRRVMASQAVWFDAVVLSVAALGLVVVVASLVHRNRPRRQRQAVPGNPPAE